MSGYARDSRYRGRPPTVHTDASGRRLTTTELRPRPRVRGTFQHTVAAGERLDQLAERYYRKPRKWWRICDANPEFESPLALVGAEPIDTVRIPITSGSTLPPWPVLLATLRDIVGVDDVTFGLEPRQLGGVSVEVAVATVVYNRLNTTPADLATAAEAAGFPTDPLETIGRVGKPIAIPPDGIR